MKVSLYVAGIILSLAVFANNANATTIYLDPAFQKIHFGQEVGVRVFVLDLPETLGAFQLDISFDPSVVSFREMVFGSNLGDPNLDVETETFVDVLAADSRQIGEISLLSEVDLAGLQKDSATGQIRNPLLLGAMVFRAIVGSGETDLTLSNVVLSNAFGVPLSGVAIGNATLKVPEPPLTSLIGLGFVALVLARNRKSRER